MTTACLPVPCSAPCSWSPTAVCAPREAFIIPCRDAFIIPCRDTFIIPCRDVVIIPAGMLGAGAVGPGGCGSFPYTATIRAIPDPQDKLYLPKAQMEMARCAGKASRRIEYLTVICLTKFYRLLCLTPGYRRNTGKRKRWEGKQRGVLKTSKTRWDWDVFLVLAGDVLQGQSAQPGTPGCGESPAHSGQAHLNKDITVSVSQSQAVTDEIVVQRIRLWG